MVSSNKNVIRFYQSVWQMLAVFTAFAFVFILYTYSEKEIDRANELRFRSYQLADELRQSSDDLTRMVRTYIITGNPLYKQHYQEILDIRDGKKPRPLHYENIYWDLILSDNQPPRPKSAHAVPLLDLMRQSGYTPLEFAKLSEAKQHSDTLTHTEYAAMKLIESTSPSTAANRQKAYEMLHSEAYHRAKFGIMKPISEFYTLVDSRTASDVRNREHNALLFRILFIALGLILIALLWRIYQSLNAVLGTSVNELHAAIALIGKGDFSPPVPMQKGIENSVFGWLSETQHNLCALDTKRKEAEYSERRLTQLYAALSQCNQAIVRCKDEKELFTVICQDAVTFGEMEMAWIGVADDTNRYLEPVAYFGNGIEYLEGLRISVDAADPSAHGPSGTVFREDRPFWCQDFQHDPATAMWHEKGARFGWGSSAALPLHRNGNVIGTLNLYSGKPNAFDEISQTLILEMISDIDYAIANFERERRQQEIETELLKRSQAIEQSSNAIIITDFKANIEYVNASFVETTGYLPSEVIGKNPRLLQSGKTPPHAYDDMWEHLTRQETWHGEFVNRRKDGSDYIYSINVSPVLDTKGNTTHYIAIEEDITEQKRSAQRIHYLANFDVLTGLPNRIQLNDHFQYTLNLAKRSHRKFAVIFLDLDHFKTINDTLGHSYGDALLIQVAASLQSILREEDTISRLGGDEFILLIPDTDTNGAAQVAQKLLEIVSKPFFIEQHELTITASIGIALYPTDGVDMEVLSKNADAAMYRAKQEGRNGYRFFTDEMQERSVRNLQLSNALHHAMERGELYLVYQPQISLRNGQIIGAEALLRWEHPELGNVPPAEFIPVAEDSGLILSIGEWVLRTASQQMQRWIESGMEPIIMAVNLSAVQFRHANLPDLVTQILNDVGLPPEYLELELTEGMAMLDPISAIEVMNDLHGRGVRMSVDDFGTGYSSLSYLKKFKVYKLKIDQSFVRDISVDSEDKAIVSAIISMAKQLGLQTIAEGVETIEQLNYLQEQGCDEIQGYHYSKPLLPEAFEAFSKKGLKISR